MKANEMPEKIFLEWYKIGDKKYREWCIIPKTNDEPVEYIRTDAFMMKARKWFEKQNEWTGLDGVRHCDMDEFEDFENYMKGE